MCDRFGIACDTQQAHQIFERHGLPSEGCSMSKLAATMADTPINMSNVGGDLLAKRVPAAVRHRQTAPVPLRNPYKTAAVFVQEGAEP